MLSYPDKDLCEIGVDEVGRGCLWGPVVAAAVLLPNDIPEQSLWNEMKDSKKLSKKKRILMANFIRENALTWGVGFASAEEIDRHNILRASHIAMHRALDEAWYKYNFKSIAVDGTHFDPYLTPETKFTDYPVCIEANCVIQGDASHLHIAAASILAKDTRDTWVEHYMDTHPEDNLELYGLKTNMGYGTAAHMKALREHGAHSLHRRSFHPVAEVVQASNSEL